MKTRLPLGIVVLLMKTLTGRELLDSGLDVSISAQPGSAVITYKKKQ